MINALAGGEAMEIIIALKDLTEGGFSKLERNIKHVESTANHTNVSGFSKAAKTMEKDAESAAGKGGRGGIGGLATGLLALADPVTIAVAAIGATVVAGIALTDTYDHIEVQEKALAIAAKDHGIALEDLNKHVDAQIQANQDWGFGADDVRGAVTRLTEAGMSLSDQQSAMTHIADLARAKNLSLTDAAKAYELALMGNQRALKDLGIALPKVTDAEKLHEKATKAVDQASKGLHTAQDRLATVEASLAGKHKLTASEALRLKQAHDKVHQASLKLKEAQHALSTTQSDAALKASRLSQINGALTTAVDGQRGAVSPLTEAQTRLGNIWEKLATAVGPVLEDLFTKLINGVSVLLTWMMQLADAAAPAFGKALEVVGGVLGHIADAVRTVIGFLGDLFAKIGQVGSAIANSPVGTLLNGAGGLAGNLLGALPHFAAGGVVDPRPGGQLALLGEGGEREFVIPESRMGRLAAGAGGVVHIHLNLDGQQIAEAVGRIQGRNFSLGGSSVQHA